MKIAAGFKAHSGCAALVVIGEGEQLIAASIDDAS